MKHLLAVVVLSLLCSAALSADTYFTWTDTDPGFFSASGTLTATCNGSGECVADSGTATLTYGALSDSFTLYVPGSGNGTSQSSPSGAFTYDNLLYYPNANPLLDGPGLLFVDSSSNELNIWGNGVYPANPYSTYLFDVGSGTMVLSDANSTFTAVDPVIGGGGGGSGVPEPETLSLLALGLVGLGLVLAVKDRGEKRNAA